MLNRPVLSALPPRACVPAPDHLGGPLVNSLWFINTFHTLGCPKLDELFHMWSKACWVEGNNPFLRSTSYFNAAQDAVGFLAVLHAAGLCPAAGCHSSSLSRSLRVTALPSNLLTVPLNLVSSTNLMRSPLSDKDIKQDRSQYINLHLTLIRTIKKLENITEKLLWVQKKHF